MSSKVDLKIYLEGYKNVSKKAQELGVEDLDKRKEELENQIKKAEETVNKMTGMTSKEFQAKSKKYIELIKNNEKELAEIDKKQEERAKNPKIEQEIKDLGQAKKNIIESAKEAANKALNELEDNKPNIKALNEKKKEQQNIEQQLKDMKQEEKTNPKKVKDTKYKEYLAQKLKTVKKEIKGIEPEAKKEETQQKAEEKEIKEELRKFLLNVGKVDRGEETIPMASDVEASKTKENEQKQTRKENKENEEYLKAWDEAIKENEIRDAWAEAEKENKQREAAKNLISKKEYAKYTDELPFDIEITLGRKGVIIYNQKEYKIPRRALRNTDELDSLEIITAIEETGMKIEDPKMLEQILKISPTDYTVIQGICMAKKMENSDKATILNNYFNECFKASKHEKVNNICNITYDLNDISKASTMKEYDRFSFLQKAKRAERYNIGKQEGRFKPTFFSKIMDKILGEGSLEKLAEKNETREIENATAINTALSKDDVTEAHNFLNSLKVDQKQNIGKDFERTTLDDEQMKEIKNVYAEEAQKREEGESR
jgi:massive surface protein mspF